MDYSKDKKMYNENMGGHNPNAGENQMHFSGNAEGGRDESISDSAGVADGLGSLASIEVKNAEDVCQNQRPKGKRSSDGGFTIGT